MRGWATFLARALVATLLVPVGQTATRAGRPNAVNACVSLGGQTRSTGSARCTASGTSGAAAIGSNTSATASGGVALAGFGGDNNTATAAGDCLAIATGGNQSAACPP